MPGLDERAEVRTIDGINYKCWPVPFGVGRPILVRVCKMVAPAIASMFKAAKEGGLSPEAGAEMLATLGANLSDEDIAKAAAAFGNAASYAEGDKWVPLIDRTQELHFAGRYDAFLLWLQFAMEVNGFARFFSTLISEAAMAGK